MAQALEKIFLQKVAQMPQEEVELLPPAPKGKGRKPAAGAQSAGNGAGGPSVPGRALGPSAPLPVWRLGGGDLHSRARSQPWPWPVRDTGTLLGPSALEHSGRSVVLPRPLAPRPPLLESLLPPSPPEDVAPLALVFSLTGGAVAPVGEPYGLAWSRNPAGRCVPMKRRPEVAEPWREAGGSPALLAVPGCRWGLRVV